MTRSEYYEWKKEYVNIGNTFTVNVVDFSANRFWFQECFRYVLIVNSLIN